MRAEVFGRDALGRLLPRWRRLEAAARAVPIASAMLAHLPAPSEPLLVTLSDGEDLCALWPLRLRRHGPLRVAERLGGVLQPYDGLLLAPDLDPTAAAGALWSALSSSRAADLLHLSALAEDSPLRSVPAIRRQAAAVGHAWSLDTAALRGPGAVLGRLSKNRRKSIRRRQRKLEERGELSFVRLQAPQDRAQAVRTAIALKAGWLEAQELHSPVVMAPWFEQSLTRAAADPALLSVVEVFALQLDGQHVALELGMRDGDSYRSYLAAFEPALSELGVGTALTVAVMQWCVDAGLARCDLLSPETDFKRSMGDQSMPMWSATLALGRRGRLALPLARQGGRLKKAYRELPPETRAPLNALLRWVI
ncbi:MAG: CelD/BcsL family acetyltransferase involved in cellulose biosynthesis [Myxococcota bacterium]|jgi:CelD/BcsL family acetyltransferase involved in cellulose biosynthesis